MASPNAAVIDFELTAPVYIGRSITPAQAARMLSHRVTASTMRRWCEEGRFRCAMFGGRWLIDRDGFEVFLAEQGVSAAVADSGRNEPRPFEPRSVQANSENG